MRSNIETKNKLTLVSELGNESKFQILKYNELSGINRVDSVSAIKSIENSGQRLKQVRILLNESAVKIQNNELSYMKGYIERNDLIHEYKGIKKLIFDSKQIIASKDKTIFKGTGEILLKSSFSDFTLIELVDEEIIISDSMFYACDEEIDIKSVKDNYKEIKLRGSGIIVLKLPVSEKEIIRCKLFNDRLTVNEDLVILKSSSINVGFEKYENVIDDNIEQYINTFYYGVGEVWLVPTRSIYDKYVKINCCLEECDE